MALRNVFFVVSVGDALLFRWLETAQPRNVVLVSDNSAYRAIALVHETV